MSKGLEALKDIIRIANIESEVMPNSKLDKDFKVIEKELKELEEHEEILNNYNLTLANFREACLLLAMLKDEGLNIHDIAKQLKALEIIKKKWVNVLYFRGSSSLEEYNSHHATWHKLIQEEYDLLKEVLL